jgi:hypothetical protein
MGWGSDEWGQPLITVQQREAPIDDQITVDLMQLEATKLTWVVKKQPVKYVEVGIYDVSFETKLVDYPTIFNKPEF